MTLIAAAHAGCAGRPIREDAPRDAPRDAPIHVDHVVYAVPALAPAESLFAALGLHAVYGGRQRQSPAENALIGLPDGSYVELLAPTDSGAATLRGRGFDGGAGLTGWAVRSANVARSVSELRERGVAVTGPHPFSRRTAAGDSLAFDLAFPGPGAPGSVLPFLIEDRTPREARVPPPASGTSASGVIGIAAVVVAVRDLPAAVALARRAFSLAPPHVVRDASLGAELAVFRGTPLVLATPSRPDGWLAHRLRRSGESPAALVLAAERPGRDPLPAHATSEWPGLRIDWLDPRLTNGWVVGRASRRE